MVYEKKKKKLPTRELGFYYFIRLTSYSEYFLRSAGWLGMLDRYKFLW